MPELPDRPDLDQLRRQARELLRAADNGEPSAVGRLRAVSDRVTLSAAQLAVAREYGYRSWAALKAEVERRPAGQPFFVTLVSEDSGAGRAAAGASVRDARTGAVTDRIKPPAGQSFMRVTSNGQGAFFLTASVNWTPGASPLVYRLRVDDGGRAGQPTPVVGDLLPPGARDIAASPGGTVLAYTVPHMIAAARPARSAEPTSTLTSARSRQRDRGVLRQVPRAAGHVGLEPAAPPSPAEAGLVDLATGERRIPSLPAGSISRLSLANDGQTLAFQWQPRSAGEAGVYVAPAAASDWVGQGKVLTDPGGLPYDAESPVISADGRAVYITVAQPEPTGGPHWTRLLEVPAGGGQPRILFELRYQAHGGNLVYMWGPVCRDRAGDRLLAFARWYVYRIEISSAAVTRLPFPEGQPCDAAW
jgi:hypothetical protein